MRRDKTGFSEILATNNKGGRAMNMLEINGIELFVKYAFPPNNLGYCGPEKNNLFFELFMDIKEKREKGAEVKEELSEELREMSKQFEAAVFYLKIIAEASGIKDFFDLRVVEAYWLGNELLNKVDFKILYKNLKKINPNAFLYDNRQIVSGAKEIIIKVKPHHTFHVLNIYMEKEFTKENRRIILEAIDNCIIRQGTVTGVYTDKKIKDFCAVIHAKHLFLELDEYDNLILEKEKTGKFFTIDKNIKVGDVVSLHYDYVCDKLTYSQKYNLEMWTKRHIEIFNGCRDNMLL